MCNLLSLILLLQFLIFSIAGDDINSEISRKTIKTKIITTRDIKLFTRNSLHGDYSHFDNLAIHGTCPIEMESNITALIFEKMINRCPKVNYFPRLLSPNQVSWKKTKLSKENDTEMNNQNHESDRKDKSESKEIISEFLAFTLLLPNHPFSNDLYLAIVAIAPMFPRVTFVVGNAREFGELCGQYVVRSFPKLLFFQKGILKGKHSMKHEAGALAAEIAKWTKLLPSSVPINKKFLEQTIKKVAKNSTRYLNHSSPSSSSSPSSYVSSMFSDSLSWLPDIGPSIEPISLSSELLTDYDGLIFVLSGIYVAIRLSYQLLKIFI